MTSTTGTSLVLGYPDAIAVRVAEKLAERGSGGVIVMSPRSGMDRAAAWISGREGIEIVEGDWNRIDFGMAGRDYLALAGAVTEIYSLVGHGLFALPEELEVFRGTAREIVELALLSGRLRRLVVLSHLDVAGQHDGPFFESDLDVGQRFAADDQHARFTAERVLRRFADRIPMVFLRTGWIPGTGLGLCPIAHLLLASPDISSKRAGDPLLLTDPESLVEICTRLDGARGTRGVLTLHLVRDPLRTVGDIAAEVDRLAREMVPASYDLAAGARRVLKTADWISRWTPKELLRRRARTTYKTDWTREFLSRNDLPDPAVTEESLARLVERSVEEIVGFRETRHQEDHQ